MDLGPITGIRPILPVNRSTAAPDLSRVFEVEYLGESADEQYEASRQRAARGLEDDEDPDNSSSDESDGEPCAPAPPSVHVNYFA